jgi:hypothetical protein
MTPKKTTVAEAEKSLDTLRDEVYAAWEDLTRKLPLSGYSWANEVYTDRVIVRMGEDYYSIPYSRSDDDITFDTDDAQKVERTWVLAEALRSDTGSLIKLIEAEGEDEPKGAVWDVVVIRPGLSENGFFYPEKALKEAVGLFDGARVLARSDDDHLQGRNKSVEKIVGWLSEPRWEKGAVRATLNLSEAAEWLRTMLLDAWNRGKKDLVGLSIVGAGQGKRAVKKGRTVYVVESLDSVSTVDVIVDPSAGGGLVKLVAALDERRGSEVDLKDATLDQLKEDNPALYEQVIAEAAKEKTSDGDPAPVTVVEAKSDPDDDEPDPDEIDSRLARFVVKEALAETELPEKVKAKVTKRFVTGKAISEKALTEAIKDEVELFADLEKDNVVTFRGEERTGGAHVNVEEAQRWKAAVDGFFLGEDVELDGEKVRRYRSFKQAYIDGTGDKRVSGHLSRTPSGMLGISEANGGTVRIRLHEAMDDSGLYPREGDTEDLQLSEAISTTQFNVILGDSVTRRMIRDYVRSNLRGAWEPVVDIVPISDFRTQRRERFGGYGNLPTVAEGVAYGALTSPTDEEVTWSPAKRGGTETINLEAIINDDIRSIQQVPRRLARAAAQTLHEFVLDFMRVNPLIYDGVALAAAGHGNNISAVALSLAELSAGRRVMREQTELDNSKPLGIIPKHLFIPAELEQLAYELTASDRKPGVADNDANYVRDMGLDYAVIDYWSDPNNWWATASKEQVGLIEVGFLFGEEPELFTQDSPNVGSMFDNDQLKYKIRHVYGGAVLDFRGFFGGIVA